MNEKLKWFAETTEYKDNIPTGIYLLDDSKNKMYAFRPNTGEIKVFKKPIRIDIRKRKFVVNPVQFKVNVKAEEPEGRVWVVNGSKGNQYRVTETNGNYSCTCSGFKFRGNCRHVKNICE